MTDPIKEEMDEIEARRTEPLNARERSVLRNKLDREHEWWGQRCEADIIRGYDDGESQTTVDQNHYGEI
jgi:hypothetical protein